MRIITGLLALIGSGVLTGSTPAQGDPIADKSDHFISARYRAHGPSSGAGNGKSAPPELVQVILRVNDILSSDQESRLRALGGQIYSHLSLIHSVALTIPVEQLQALASLDFVQHLSEDVVTQKHDAFTNGSTGADVAYQQYGVSGTGVTVAVIDSGVKLRTDLKSSSGKSRILANVSFVPNSPKTDDFCGHGTHVAGIIAGNGLASTGSDYYRTFLGVARNSNIVNVRVLDPDGHGVVSTVIAGILWCVQNKAAYNIRVINLSLGHSVGESYATDPLCQSVELAWKAGIVVVCAAGNNGRLNTSQTAGLDNEGWGTAYGSIQSPGNDPYVITVGCTKSVDGTRANDTISTYSGRGPTAVDAILKPDIVAPGNQVISLRAIGSYLDVQYGSTNIVPLSYYVRNTNDTDPSQYFRLSGTSMAAPVVAGAAALMLQADSTLTPDTIKARLMISADKWGFSSGLYDPCTFGAGYLNIPAALNCTVTAKLPAQSPTLVTDSASNVYLNQIIWGDQIIWGTPMNDMSQIYGTPVISAGNAISINNVSWGVQGSQIIWGEAGNSAPDTTGGLDITSILGDD